MTVTIAEIKIGLDILSRLFKFFKGVSKTNKEKVILSTIYKELLLGDKADIAKIEAMLMQVEKLGSTNPDFVRAKNYFAKARVADVSAARSGKIAIKYGAMKIVKKSGAKKVIISKKKKATKTVAKKMQLKNR
jgi:hypothetical protein